MSRRVAEVAMLGTASSEASIHLFCSYDDADRSYRDALKKHLTPALRAGRVDWWDPACILPGEEPDVIIDERLRRARIVVLLLSSDFLANDMCWKTLQSAREARRERGLRLVPILVRDVDLTNALLHQLQRLPKDGLPVKASTEPDRTWRDISTEILSMLKESPRGPHVVQFDAGSMWDEKETVALREARILHELGHTQIYKGELSSALANLMTARDKLETLVLRDIHASAPTRELAKLYDRIGQAMYVQGRLEAAREAFDHAFGFRSRLRAVAPEVGDLLRDICASHYWRGHLGSIEGDLLRAWNEQQAGVFVCRRLLDERPDDPKVMRDLVVLETDLGSTLHGLQETDRARQHLSQALSSARHLAARYPENLQFRRDLAVGLFRLADVLIAHGDLDDATRACEESTQLCEALSRLDEGNVHWKRHVASAKLRLGIARALRGACEDAQAEIQSAGDIVTALAAIEPGNLQWRHDCAVVDRELAELARRRADVAAARVAYGRAVSTMESICEQTRNLRWKLDRLDLYVRLLDMYGVTKDAPSSGMAEARSRAAKLMGELHEDMTLHGWAKRLLAEIRERGRQLELWHDHASNAMTSP